MDRPPHEADPGADPRLRARAELLWYLRHADALRRWPVLGEPWALAVEQHRLGDSGDRVPGSGDGSAQ